MKKKKYVPPVNECEWWKALCLDCGSNTDLLTDKDTRIICRECLRTHEFKEVENEFSQIEASPVGINDSRENILRNKQERLPRATRGMDKK